MYQSAKARLSEIDQLPEVVALRERVRALEATLKFYASCGGKRARVVLADELRTPEERG